MTAPLKLTRLLNADGETVGYFSDHVAEMAARREWDAHTRPGSVKLGANYGKCRSIETPIVSAELEDVEPGDGDREDYVEVWEEVGELVRDWTQHGAASVEVQRFLINKYRRPGMSSRDADLGGPVEAAGVLYVLRVKALK